MFNRIARMAAEAAAETLWPTRCALCDTPGEVLCERCIRDLPYLDWWRACRRCGAPYGLVQCDSCNRVSLERLGRDRLPYAGCASATLFSESSGCVVRVCKDQGEQRLAAVMGELMCRVVPPSWAFDAVTFVPATLGAYRYRGFDHAQLIASHVAEELEMPAISLLDRPKTSDQRKLTGAQRMKNLRSGFNARASAEIPRRLLLVDDVYTTGATICAATDALVAAGADCVYCLTFARV